VHRKKGAGYRTSVAPADAADASPEHTSLAGVLRITPLTRQTVNPGSSAIVPPLVAPSRYVLLPLAELVTGYTVKAMERKIERGDWVEGKLWRRAPDGHILIDLVGYQKWVESA
jgi:hypothetical protein